jgi:hypothetical protein
VSITGRGANGPAEVTEDQRRSRSQRTTLPLGERMVWAVLGGRSRPPIVDQRRLAGGKLLAR